MYTIHGFTLLVGFCAVYSQREFKIDYSNNRFLMDGKPFRYISGSIHYYRITPYYWRDRLTKMKAAGLNTVEFYVPWNFHESYPGKFTFSGRANLGKFLDLVQELQLKAILRGGPFSGSEIDFGGLPWWLLKFPQINIRSSDQIFLTYVKRWFGKLYPKLIPYLHKNGGPIILIQVENEYGSFGGPGSCDMQYTTFLRDLIRQFVGYDTVLMTTDGGSLGYLKCGYIPDVYPTVDFGPTSEIGVQKSFQAQRAYAPQGPLVNSEFYPGWLQRWHVGDNFPSVGSILETMDYMYAMNASFNFYMFTGGTNFAYINAGYPKDSGNPSGWPVTTTYDYNAPINEAGDPTEKYWAIRDKIRNLTGINPPTVPGPTQKFAYGNVTVSRLGTVQDMLPCLTKTAEIIQSYAPLTMEEMDAPYGFVLYETKLPESFDMTGVLSVSGIKDRGYVMVDGVVQGILNQGLDTTYEKHSVEIQGDVGEKLQILVENLGRTHSGVRDFKGIISAVTLDDQFLNRWTMYPLSLEKCMKKMLKSSKMPKARRLYRNSMQATYSPSIYMGTFSTLHLYDTFLDPTNWTKGQFLINGFNVGKYWPVMGPQVTLYTPKSVLESMNHVMLFELERPGNCVQNFNTCFITFADKPNIHKPVDVHAA